MLIANPALLKGLQNIWWIYASCIQFRPIPSMYACTSTEHTFACNIHVHRTVQYWSVFNLGKICRTCFSHHARHPCTCTIHVPILGGTCTCTWTHWAETSFQFSSIHIEGKMLPRAVLVQGCTDYNVPIHVQSIALDCINTCTIHSSGHV